MHERFGLDVDIGGIHFMEATLFKQVGYSLSKLIEDIDIGEIGLPDIQRPFVWTTAKVRDLFDSMYKGFPLGYLLFWINTLNGNDMGADNKVTAAGFYNTMGDK
jgi:hypothetical protein